MVIDNLAKSIAKEVKEVNAPPLRQREAGRLGGNAFDLEARLSDLGYRWGMHPGDLKDGLLHDQLGSIEGHHTDPNSQDQDEPLRLRMVAAGRS